MRAIDKITELFRQHGCTLKRHKRHEVWNLPNGRVFTRPKTPSDHRADENNLTDLKRELGLTKRTATIGERRKRKAKSKRGNSPTFRAAPINTTLADQLVASGSVEYVLRGRIAELEAQMRRCWGCRIRQVFRNTLDI